jgi:peptide/nickel transport system permease protein
VSTDREPTDASGSPDDQPIAPVDWDSLDGSRLRLTPRLVGFLVALAALGALYYRAETRGVDLLLGWQPTTLTWVFRVCLVAVVFLFVPPVVRNRELAADLRDRLKSDWYALASFLYLGAFAVLAVVGPILAGRPRTNIKATYQPPFFGSVPYGSVTLDCSGQIVGEGIARRCLGSFAHPLGTARVGQDMVTLLLSGMHVSMQVAIIALVLIVPVATVVGVTAGYFGGRVDTVLMRYVEVQQTIPALVVYLIAVFILGNSLFLLIVIFGLFNWGNVARLVRSEVLQRREEEYIEAARSAGVSETTILRRHILPNVSNTVLVGATQKVPQLVLFEAGLTFIELGDVGRWYTSFGEMIRVGFQPVGNEPATAVWWLWVFPVVVLAGGVISISVVGDVLRDVIDPRGDL